jgi:DNA-binding transcriptional regulator YbjK
MNHITFASSGTVVAVPPRRRWLATAAGVVAAAVSAPAPAVHDTPAVSELEQAREELARLCEDMELLRAWYQVNEAEVRAWLPRLAPRAHDLFINGAISSRQVARRAGIIIDMDFVNATVGGNS